MLRKSAKIDYIRFTLDKSSDAYDIFPPVAECSHTSQYDEGWTCAGGVVVFGNRDYARQGSLVSIGGKALDVLRASEDNLYAQALALADKSRNVTRLDLALDVTAHGSTHKGFFPHVRDFWELWQAGGVRSRATKGTFYDNVQKGKKESLGATVYIGSRESETFLRVYDKAQELKLVDPDEFWTRFEVEKKQRLARVTLDDILSGRKVQEVTVNAIRNFSSFEDEYSAWNEIFEGVDDTPLTQAGRKITDFNEYLKGVFKTITKRAKMPEDAEHLQAFIKALGVFMME